ncbi:MAG: hypothetical protein QOK39_987 [Acidimicrobiaceae bacterium]|nr:hypothetical protein [Acidimicrobiaceae bacterium]
MPSAVRVTATGAAPATLREAAQTIGGYVWLEERLFETLGGWVPDVAEAEVKVHLAAGSHHHAWHALLWRERLPELREMVAEGFVVPPGARESAFVDALAAAYTTVEKLVGVYRVALPRQVGIYTRHREEASPITDGPTIRALDLVLADQVADWRAGELLIQAVLTDVAMVELGAAHQARLEALWVAGGGGGRESNPPDGDRPSQPL